MTGRTGPEGRGTLGEAAAGQSIGIVSGAAAAQAPALAGASRVVDTTAPVRVGDKRAHWRRRAAYAVMITYAILMFIPFAWSLITSFQNLNPSIFRLFANSAGIALAVTLSNLFLASLAGYAFARLRFPGREVLFLIVLATLMIPDQLRLVPVYLIMNAIGLTRGPGQYLAVVLVMAIMGTNIFLMRQYFLSIPRDIEEAARIDGAGFFTTFWRVMLPLAGPAIAAVAILQFQGTWNGFFWPVVFLHDPSHWTLPLGLTQFRGS